MPTWIWTDDLLTRSARWLAELHEASAGFDESGPWQMAGHEPREVICHNDFAPYNFVFDTRPSAGRGDRLRPGFAGVAAVDLAYLAYRLVPLTSPTTSTARRLDRRAGAPAGAAGQGVRRRRAGPHPRRRGGPVAGAHRMDRCPGRGGGGALGGACPGVRRRRPVDLRSPRQPRPIGAGRGCHQLDPQSAHGLGQARGGIGR